MKKIIISTDVLKPALNNLAQAVAKNASVPALENLYCKAISATEIELITSDLELTIIQKCQAEISGAPFDLLIPFTFFRQIVSFNKSMPIAIEFEKGKARIIGESDIYELGNLEKAQDYPKLPDLPKQNTVNLSSEFIQWITRAQISVGNDETRPALMNVCLELNTTAYTIAATDAHIIFTHKFIPVESKSPEELLISPKIVKAISKFQSVQISYRKSHIGFQEGDLTIIATRLEHKYVNYSVAIPPFEKNLTVKRTDLIGALERCALSTSELKDTTLYLKKETTSILFEALDEDLNRKIDARILGSYSGTAEMITVNADNFLRLMAQVDFEEINLAISSPAKAIVLTSDSDKEYLGLIMPIAPKQ